MGFSRQEHWRRLPFPSAGDFPGSGIKLTSILSPALAGVLFTTSANAGDPGSIPGSGRCPGERNGNPLHYSSPRNPMDRGDRQAVVHGVTKESNMT